MPESTPENASLINKPINTNVQEGKQTSKGRNKKGSRKKTRVVRQPQGEDLQKLGRIVRQIVGVRPDLVGATSGHNPDVHDASGDGVHVQRGEVLPGQTHSVSNTADSGQQRGSTPHSTTSVHIDAGVIELFKSWDDPCVFGEWLFDSPLEQWQRETLYEFAKTGRIARAVCNGGGKTRLFAIAGPWWLVKRKNPRVVMTAGAYRQLDCMRDELAIPIAKGKLPGWQLKEHELIHPDGAKMLWYSADNPGLFEGQHAENLALFADESKSIKDDIALAFERLQPKVMLCMSSPGGASGWFYKCFGSLRKFWNTAHVKAETCSRIPKEWIAQMREMHKENPELLASMLDAQFVSSEPDIFIQLGWINRLLENPPRYNPGQRVAGIDLSASVDGDESVIIVRDGNKIIEIVAWRDPDPMRVAGKCMAELARLGVPKENVFADAGGLGSGIVARMREIGWPVHGVQFGASPLAKSERIQNRATEVWDTMANEIQFQRIILPNDSELITQLTSRKFHIPSSGKLKLETKQEMKKRGLPSPDRADALALCLQNPEGARATQFINYFSNDNNRSPYNPDERSGFMSADGRFDFGN